MSFEQTTAYLNTLNHTPSNEIDAEMALKLAYYALSDSKKSAGTLSGYHSLPQMVAALTEVCTAVKGIYDGEIASLSDGSTSGRLKRKLDGAKDELAAIQAGTDSISGDIAALEAAEKELEAAKAKKQAELAAQQQKNDIISGELAKKQAELAEREREYASLTEDADALEAQLAAIGETIEQAKKADGQTENLLARLSAFKDAFFKLFKSNVTKEGLKQKGFDPETLQNDLTARIDEAQQMVDRLREEIHAWVKASEALTQEAAEEKPAETPAEDADKKSAE